MENEIDYSLEAQYEDRTHVEDGADDYGNDIGNDVSEYADEPEPCEETEDCASEPLDMSDVEADANTLASAGYGTDEDYEHNLCDDCGCYGE